jgi:hypothetical protein
VIVQVPTGKRISEGCKKNIENIRKSQVVVPFCSSFNQLFPAIRRDAPVFQQKEGMHLCKAKDV